ncbi:MAG: hypothetical protein LQ338_006454 [Usnochroma carphineum]|nr:MAG: hypothetical protein LQ338_006454 [Usnochroma carphineum]
MEATLLNKIESSAFVSSRATSKSEFPDIDDTTADGSDVLSRTKKMNLSEEPKILPLTKTSNNPTSSSADTTTMQDPSLKLFRRMNQLSTSLCVSRPTSKTIIAINRKLDELEDILSASSHGQDKTAAHQNGGLGFLGTIDGPKRFVQSAEQDATIPLTFEPLRLPGPAADAIDERSQLLSRVAEAMRQLRQRQREMKEKQFHDRIVAEVQRSAEQAGQAKAQNEYLINNLMDDEAELNYLKLKLRILEIQTVPYVPLDDYDGLAAGIRRWKSDWAEIQRRQRRRRWERVLDEQVDSYH